jgi:hypothetical protein
MVFFAKSRLRSVMKKKDLAYLEKLYQNGIDLNIPLNKHGDSILHLAAKEGWDAGVGFLVDNGAKINALNKLDWTPLHFAAARGRMTAAVILLKKGADPNLRTQEEGKSAQGIAQAFGHNDVAQVIGYGIKKPHELLNTPTPFTQPALPVSEWVLVSPQQVAHLQSHERVGYRLTDIFNFQSRERVRITFNLHTRSDVIDTKSFDEIPDKGPLEEAFQNLKRLGGQANQSVIYFRPVPKLNGPSLTGPVILGDAPPAPPQPQAQPQSGTPKPQ